VTLGRYCFVGAGSVVTHDVPDYALVYGSPARMRGWVCNCGAKLDLDASARAAEVVRCAACGCRYRRADQALQELV